MQTREAINQLLEAKKLLPLYTATDLSLLDQVEELLLKHDLPIIEVTFRSELATQTIKRISQSGKIVVGAGTVRSLEQAKLAVENGAQFIVSPALVEDVVEYCNDQGIAVYPGTVTPRDIQLATEYGLKTVKFFPADVYGGINAIKALSGPFSDVRFLPTGGVNADNLESFLSIEPVIAVGGSFILTENKVKESFEVADKNLENLVAIVNKI